MARESEVDRLIAEALRAEGVEGLGELGEPGLPELVTEIFRSRLRWYGILFFFMIAVFGGLAVLCAVRSMAALDLTEIVRWGVGFLACLIVVIGGKTWYWMQMDRVAMSREIKRVELQIVHLATVLRERG